MANTINAKSTKKDLITFIKESVKTVKDKGLLSRIKYTLKSVEKDEAGVPKRDIYDLAKEIMDFMTPAPVAVENSPKPKLGKKKTAKAEEVEPEVEEPEDEEETEEEAPAPAPKKQKKGGITMSKSKKKEEPAKVESTEGGLTKKELPMAKVFPKEIDHESLGKLVACPDKYHTVQEIREALEEGKNLVFACYWTKRHIKEFAYGLAFEVPVPKNGFPHDLDTLQALYVCEGVERIYALSTYTEAMFRFNSEDLEPTECEANDGSKFKMRYSSGMEYEIYEVVDEETAE